LNFGGLLVANFCFVPLWDNVVDVEGRAEKMLGRNADAESTEDEGVGVCTNALPSDRELSCLRLDIGLLLPPGMLEKKETEEA